jgi:ABC-type spermidine/putrescine transport system permease subunit I
MTDATLVTAPEPKNAARLARADRAEAVQLGLLTAPGLLLVVLLLVAPLAWLGVLSFIGDGGGFSFENYERLTTPLYVKVVLSTLQISAVTTVVTALLGYPVAYLLSQAPKRVAALCLVMVILPFWTSVLVRTYAWIVLLQRNGLINETLIALGLTDAPLNLTHNALGTVIGMVHIMLPFMIMPLYSTMSGIDGAYLKAASTCGASPARAFRDVFFPMTREALFSGVILVFVLCLGFYLTPALLGGGKVPMVSMQIESNVREYGNWGAASALGVLVIVLTVMVLGVLRKTLRIDDMRETR